MFYDFAIAVPAGTLESAKVEQELHLGAGIIHNVRILFPPGPHAMVRVRLLHWESPFVPTNFDGYLASDDEVIVIDEYFELKTAPYTLKAQLWSPGTTYPHTIDIRVGLLAAEDVNPAAGLGGMLGKLLNFFGIRG